MRCVVFETWQIFKKADLWIGTWLSAMMRPTSERFSDLVTRPVATMESRACLPPDFLVNDSFARRPGAPLSRHVTGSRAEWNAGRSRRSRMSWSRTDPIDHRVFRELLSLELELTHHDGRSASLDAYLLRFPGRGGTVRQVFAIAGMTEPFPGVTEPGMTKELGSSPTGYELIRELGKGGQATTYLARGPTPSAPHWLCSSDTTGSARRAGEGSAQRGPRLARFREIPFVAPCYGVESRGEEIDLVVEYVPGGRWTS